MVDIKRIQAGCINVPYNNTGTPYILGALTDQTVTVFRDRLSNSKRWQVSSHNYGLPLKTVTYANGYQTSTSSYGYNAIFFY